MVLLLLAGDPGIGNINVNVGNSNNWTEGNLSTANAPVAGSLLGNLNKTYSLNQAQTFTLNNLSVSGNFLTLVVTQTNGNDVSFSSDENATGKPVLTINYNGSAKSISAENTISMYPNPTLDGIFVNVGDGIGASIKVNSLNGSLVAKATALSSKTYVDLSKLAKGIYIVSIVKNGELIKMSKVIKN